MGENKENNITITTAVRAFESVFDKANKRFYGGLLTRPVFTFSPVVKKNCINYGHFTLREVWHKGDLSRCEININCCAIETPERVIGTILHEMAHAYAYANEIKDCSTNGYHNLKFKEIAENHGLSCADKGKYGYNETSLNDDGKVFANSIKDSEELVALKRDVPVSKESTSKNISYKYVCPICGAIARTTKELTLICGECREVMELDV